MRETALGLKFDSTLMTARTRLGSTLCRDAAWSMAASISCCVNGLPRTKLETCCEVLTSAAAERAARILADGTDFQACAVGLQYISPLLCAAELFERSRRYRHFVVHVDFASGAVNAAW